MKYYIFDIETYIEDKDLNENAKEYLDDVLDEYENEDIENITLNLNVLKDKKIKFGICIMKDMNTGKMYYFDDVNALKQFMLSNKHQTKIFIGHNIYNFDLMVIFEPKEFIENLEIHFQQNKIVSIRVKDKPIYFIDTYNIFQSSLKKLGEMIGLQKGNLQKELSIMRKDEFEKRKNEISQYCLNDVLITEKVFQFYLNELQKYKEIKRIWDIKLTTSSYSFDYFNYLNGYSLNGKNFKDDILFLETYYGGRVEPIFIGYYDNPIFVYDVNSLYPFVMRNFEYPLMPIDELYNKDIDENDLKDYEGIVFAKIRASKGVFGFYDNENNFIDIGLLPYRSSIDKDIKLIFPIGEYYGFFNLNEIRNAIKKGYEIELYYAYLWKKGKIPKIKEFIDYFYDLKLKHKNDITGFNAKLILNSLYGKFGQNTGGGIIISENEYYDNVEKYDKYEVVYTDPDLPYIFLRDNSLTKSKSSYFNLSSYITSNARLYLLELMEKFISYGNLILYMDTDSLFTNKEINDPDIIGNELGKLKLEKTSSYIEIYGAKSYKTDKENHFKGIPKENKLLYENELKKVFLTKRILKPKTYLKNRSFDEMYMFKTSSITFKRNKGLNIFLDAINLNTKLLYLKKEENSNKLNEILRKNDLKNQLEIIVK